MTISSYSTTASANTTVNGHPVDDGLHGHAIPYAIKQVMADLAAGEFTSLYATTEVGIGTTDTDEALHIVGTGAQHLKVESTTASGFAGAFFQNGNTGQTSTDGLQVGYSNAGYIWNYENTAVAIATNNTLHFKVEASGAIAIKDGITAPSAASGWARIYVDTADGDLKVIFGDGTVKTIVVDT